MTAGSAIPLTNLKTVKVPLTKLFRLSKRPVTEPYFGATSEYRFDSETGAYGVLYCGDTPMTSFAESVLHSSTSAWEATRGAYVLTASELGARHLVKFSHPHKTHLLMADLTGAGLKGLGLNNDVCAGPDYTLTQALSEDIHAASDKIDGIRYVSRQMNTNFCFAIFERSGVTREPSVALDDATLKALCRRFNVKTI